MGAIEHRRVVITGLGAVTPLGNDVRSTWGNLVAGRSGIRMIESFDPSRLNVRIAGEVHDLDASAILDRKELRRTDRYIQMALVAVREALDEEGATRYLCLECGFFDERPSSRTLTAD